jgi:prophage regulatory protein
MSNTTPRRTIRRDEVILKTGLARTTIYHLEKRGEFPRHFMITPRCAVWFEDEIDEWLESRRDQEIEPASWPDVSKRKSLRGRPPRKQPTERYRTFAVTRLGKK